MKKSIFGNLDISDGFIGFKEFKSTNNKHLSSPRSSQPQTRLDLPSIMSTTAELRQLLKEDANGQNLYDHLTQTLMRILIERPKNAFEAFELISAEVKGNPLNPDPEHGKPLPMSAEQVREERKTSLPLTSHRLFSSLIALEAIELGEE